MAALGAVAGAGLAVLVARVLEALLYGIDATDLPTYGWSLAVLGMIAFAAAYVPTRRVGRIRLVQAAKVEE